MSNAAFCPQCGRQRTQSMRFCIQCGLDFDAVQLQPTGTLAQAQPGAVDEPIMQTAGHTKPNETLPIIAGIAWLIGAAAIGYLAFLQLEYSGLGLADADDARGLALWNGAAAAITAYFGTMAIVARSRQRMGGAVIWAVINVAWGTYQVSQGLTHEAFLVSLVAFGLAGVLALVAWNQMRQTPTAIN